MAEPKTHATWDIDELAQSIIAGADRMTALSEEYNHEIPRILMREKMMADALLHAALISPEFRRDLEASLKKATAAAKLI